MQIIQDVVEAWVEEFGNKSELKQTILLQVFQTMFDHRAEIRTKAMNLFSLMISYYDKKVISQVFSSQSFKFFDWI